MKIKKQNIALVSLGCPKNTVDSENVAGMLTAGGFRLVSDTNQADIAIVNTCGFIKSAAQESIDRILELNELKKTGKLKKLLVMGCLINRYGNEIVQELPEVDGFFKVNAVGEIAKFLRITGSIDSSKRLISTPGHYAYIKISEGCDMRCTFCTIPKIRGPHISEQMNSVVEECKRLSAHGVKEVILISQDTTWYGHDLGNGNDLSLLIRHIGKIPGIQWIRIMYAHPGHINSKFIKLLSEEKKVCKYLDMPVQHIADPVLSAMRRAGRKTTIYRLIDKLRKNVPGIALRTTLLVGFPGETEKHFTELLDFVKDVEFERLGVFGYSPEEGTPAYLRKDRIPAKIIKERLKEIMKLQKQITRKKNISLLGKSFPVLIDSFDPGTGWSVGRTEYDAPEIDQRVLFSRKILPGTMLHATFIGAADHDLFAA